MQGSATLAGIGTTSAHHDPSASSGVEIEVDMSTLLDQLGAELKADGADAAIVRAVEELARTWIDARDTGPEHSPEREQLDRQLLKSLLPVLIQVLRRPRLVSQAPSAPWSGTDAGAEALEYEPYRRSVFTFSVPQAAGFSECAADYPGQLAAIRTRIAELGGTGRVEFPRLATSGI